MTIVVPVAWSHGGVIDGLSHLDVWDVESSFPTGKIGLWLHMITMVYGWFMVGLWLVYGWFMIGLWLVYGC